MKFEEGLEGAGEGEASYDGILRTRKRGKRAKLFTRTKKRGMRMDH